MTDLSIADVVRYRFAARIFIAAAVFFLAGLIFRVAQGQSALTTLGASFGEVLLIGASIVFTAVSKRGWWPTEVQRRWLLAAVFICGAASVAFTLADVIVGWN